MLEILSSTFGRFVCLCDCLSPFPEFGSVRSVPGTSIPIPWHDGSALRRPVFSGWLILSLTPGWTLSIEWRDGIINPDDWTKNFLDMNHYFTTNLWRSKMDTFDLNRKLWWPMLVLHDISWLDLGGAEL